MADDVFAGRLLSDEKIIWSGRPGPGLLLTPRDIFLIPFSLLWGGFAIFWEFTAIKSHGPLIPFDLFGAVFVVIGLFFIFGRFLADMWLRGGLRYAITTQRVLILRTTPTFDFTALDLARIPSINLAEGRNGRGTIRLGPSTSLWGASRNSGFSMWMPSTDPTPQLLAIEDVRSVFDRMQALTVSRRAAGL